MVYNVDFDVALTMSRDDVMNELGGFMYAIEVF